MLVFLHCVAAGRKGPLWLHLRSWAAGLCQYVHSVEPDEYERCVSRVCDERPWLLPPPHGPTLSHLTGAVAAVSHTHARTRTHARTHRHAHVVVSLDL